MYCKNCGTKLSENAKFCSKCGNDMTGYKKDKKEREKNDEELIAPTKNESITQKDSSFKLTGQDRYSDADMDYFAVPTWRLILFSILSLGLYEIYWFYKNWEVFKEKANPAISPFWRSVMPQFFCHGLFAQILYSARLRGYKTNYYPWLLYFIYVFTIIIGRAENPDPSVSLIFLVIALLSFIPLLVVQQAIIYNNQSLGLEKTKKINASEIIITLVGLALLVFSFINGLSQGMGKINNSSDVSTNNVVNYFTNTDEWKDFTSPIGSFKVLLPKYPQHESSDDPIPTLNMNAKTETYTSSISDNQAYMVTVTNYSKRVDNFNVDGALEGALNGMLATDKNNKLISSGITTFNGYKSTDFLIQTLSEGQTAYLKGKVFIVDQTLYALALVYMDGNYNDSDYNKFMSSFALLK